MADLVAAIMYNTLASGRSQPVYNDRTSLELW